MNNESPATMLAIDPATMNARDTYRLATSLIAPRPIAWVSTVSADGAPNLAPFSFFNLVGHDPVTVMISIGSRNGGPKDTLRNVQATREFVVNLGDEALAEAMNQTSGDYQHGENEFEKAGVASAPSVIVRPARVALAPAALEVRCTQIVPVQDTGYTMILGQVVQIHLRADLMRANGLADTAALQPVARLGGDEWAALGRVFTFVRPKV